MKKIYFFFFYLLIIHQSSHAQWSLVGSPFTSIVRGLYFENADTGYAAGYNLTVGQISKTLDGGVTWNTTSINGSYLMRSVTFVNNDTGFACGVVGNGVFPATKGLVIETVDGGANWNVIFTDTPQYFRAVNFISPDTGFLAGAAGTILKTTDGGANWTTITLSQTTSDVIQLRMANSQIGYAVCAGPVSPFYPGYVFKTIDGGDSWDQVYYDGGFGYLGLAVANETVVYAGGDSTIIKTSDGGLTWDTVYTNAAINVIRSGFAVSENEAYLVSDASHVVSTVDGGTTWSDTILLNGLYSVYFINQTGYTGDGGGNVYKTEICDAPDVPTITFNNDTLMSSLASTYQWYYNGTLIPGATNQTYSPTQNGFYTVTITNEGNCSSTSLPFDVIGEGINTVIESAGLEIFPNLLNSFAVISITGSDSPQYLSISDVRGKVLRSITVTRNQKIMLDRNDFAEGLYFISLLNENHGLIARSKLFVQ